MTRDRVRAVPPDRVDVAVIGCGTAGLFTAAYLAKRGLNVAVFDPHYVAGGCATQFSRGKKGHQFLFDVGLHYVGECGTGMVIDRLIGGLGLDIDFEELDPNGFDNLVFPDFEFKVPKGVENYRQRLVEVFPSERKGIDKYVTYLRELDEVARKVNANEGHIDWRVGLHVVFKARSAVRWRNATLNQVLDSCTSHPQLRAVLAGQNGDYGLPPSMVAAPLHLGLQNHYLGGAWYPKGGGQLISDKAASYVEANGGTVHLRRGVDRILVEHGAAVGVRTRSHTGDVIDVRAAAVVSGADLAVTLLDLLGPDHLSKKEAERAKSFTMPWGLVMTYLGLSGDVADRGMGNRNYWQFDGYDFDAMYKSQLSGGFEPFCAYITSGTLKDPNTPGHAPEGASTVEIMSLVPGPMHHWGADPAGIVKRRYAKEGGYQAQKQAIEDNLIARFERLFPGVSEDIVFRESSTPVTQTRYTGAVDGSPYGIAATPGQFLENRPGYRGPVKNLYLCGHSTKSGHGIMGAMHSGYQAARRVAKDRGTPIASVFKGF